MTNRIKQIEELLEDLLPEYEIGNLSEWETSFYESVTEQYNVKKDLSDDQINKLEEISEQIRSR